MMVAMSPEQPVRRSRPGHPHAHPDVSNPVALGLLTAGGVALVLLVVVPVAVSVAAAVDLARTLGRGRG